MRFYNYLNEVKGKLEFTGNIDTDKIIKEVEKWRKDLRKLTKILRSLEYPQNNSDAREWEKVHKMFIRFRQNFEDWIQNYIKTTDDPNKEGFYEASVREAAHKASLSLSIVFADGTFRTDDGKLELAIDVKTTLRRRENNIREYNKEFNKVWETIDKLVKREKKEVKRFNRLETFNYAGVELSINWGKKDRTTEELEKISKGVDSFIVNLKDILKRVEAKGLKTVLKDLRIKIDFDLKDVGGTYRIDTDIINMSFWTFDSHEYRSRTFYHELAHRFFYKYLPENLKKKWRNAINETKIKITNEHIEKFVEKYFPFKDTPGVQLKVGSDAEDLRNYFMEHKESPEDIAVYSHIAGNFDHTLKYKKDKFTKDNVLSSLKKNLVGDMTSSWFISNYANKNADEAFAEAVSIWLEHHIGRLPSEVRYILKDMFESMGIKIEEKKTEKFRRCLLERSI